MTKNPVNHGRAKHIDIKYHHIRDEVKRGEVKLEYCETAVMLADIMTKGLHGPRHKVLTTALGIKPSSHCGGVLNVQSELCAGRGTAQGIFEAVSGNQ